MLNKDKQERSHIIYTNMVAILALLIYTIVRWIYLNISGYFDSIFPLLVLSGSTIVLLIIVVALIKTPELLALFVPGLIAIMLFIGAFWTDGLSFIFIGLAGLCSLSGAYLCLKSFFRFIVLLNFMLFFSMIVLRFPISGGEHVGQFYYENWILMIFCMLGIYLTVRHVANRQCKSNIAMTSFHTMLATTPNMVALVDELNRVTFISNEFINLANAECAEYAMGRPLFDLLPNNEMVEMIANDLDSVGSHVNTIKVEMNGEYRYFKIIFVQMEVEGEEKGKLIDITDVTPIMWARDEAERASKAKSDFLSKMSHEIRTPMNAVLGMAELILLEDIPEPARERAITIKHSGEHLLSIINDILDFSKIESGKLEIVNTEYLFYSIINDVISIIKMRMTNPELHFAVYMEHDIPNELFGDEVRIRQVLLNVLTNSMKYTKKGYFSLDITGERVSDDTIKLTIKIKDTGIGIKPEDMKKLFLEFSQFELEKNRNIEGTGLGLAITHNLVKLMGGTISATSVYGEGSEFIIYLPQKLHEKYHGTDYSAIAPRFEDKSVLLYGSTPIYTNYAARSLADLGVSYHIIFDDSELHNKLLEGKWDYVFAEEDLAHTSQHIISTRELDTKVVMMTDSYKTNRAKSGKDFSTLIMPAYFTSVVIALNNGSTVYFANNLHIDQFIAPEANILLVDDIYTNLKVGEGLLKLYHVNVTLCTSGKEAIEAVKSKDYDVILMDHMMPEMDGIEAVKIIRGLDSADSVNSADSADSNETTIPAESSIKSYSTIPIIALTANAIVGAREMFLQNGFDDFISKPIDITKLNGILAKWIPIEKQKQADTAITETNDGICGISSSDTELDKINLEDVDIAKGISLSGGSLSSYLDTLAVFHKDGTAKIYELANCIESNNLSLYTIYVHALKSACANIGANKLSSEAKILESAGAKQDIGFIMKHNANFMDSLKKLLANIEKAIASTTSNSYLGIFGKHSNHTTFDNIDDSEKKNFEHQLAKLKTALENYDVTTIDEVSVELQKFKQFPDISEVLDNILQNAFVGKYKQALVQIEEIIN